MIVILLSVYNGSCYLDELLDSIQKQSYEQWSLLVRDDDSLDGSSNLVKKFANKNLNKVILSANKQNLGVKRSFGELIKMVIQQNKKDNYFMFADQDDYWLKKKVEKTYQKMQELESIYGKDIPILVHSNLTVVDEKLNILAPSFWKYQHIDPSKDSLNRLLLHNTVTGCTMMINRALAEKIKNIPHEAIMHDWWVAMVASAFGKIAYIDESLMLYRQHGKNDTGAKQYGLRYFIKKFFAKPSLAKYIHQSKAFLALYGHELDEYHKSMLEEFSSFDGLSKFQKLRVLFKYKIWKSSFMRNIGLIFFA